MIDNYEIVPANVADWPDLLYIFDKSLRTTDNLSDDDWKALYKNLISFSYPTYDTYVFKKEGKNVAYISYWREKKLIKMLYVLPEYMNQGIANLLIQHILSTYHETMTIGVKKITKSLCIFIQSMVLKYIVLKIMIPLVYIILIMF